MDKEQLIRELKYTKEKHKNDKLHTFDTDISAMCSDVLDVLSRCVEIPDNATRKDVHKLIFGILPPELDSPYCECALADNGKGCEKCVHKNDLNCDVNWWNSPYK